MNPNVEKARSHAVHAPSATTKWFALGVALSVAVVTALLFPSAATKWPNIPAFVPAYQTALIGAYLIAAYLMHGHFKQRRTRSMLWLWSGSIYTAGVLAAQFLSLPNVFVANTRLLGGPQTTIWLWFFWHLGAGGMLLGYALSEWRLPAAQAADPVRAIRRTAILTALVLGVTLATVTHFHDALPVEDVGGDFSRVTSTGYGPLIQVIIMAALFFLWHGSRFRTPASAWIGVAMVALAFDNAITMAGGTRLSVGWYVGRLNALISALIMLVLYLKEVHRGYLEAAASAAALTIAKRELELHQESLESVVRERTKSLEETQNALLHAQKLEALGKLTGGVAHDFNNVLHIISGNLDLLRLLASGNEKVLQRCASAQEAVRRGGKLTSQLLSFARKQPLQPVAVDLAQLFTDFDQLLKRALGSEVEVIMRIDPAAGNVMADPQQLENVILNIALNARDAMPQGGRLAIDVHDQMHDAAYVCLSFADTGTGMSDEVRQHLFEPFFSTKGVGKGTGLGLAMAYGFIKQSGGQIDVASTVGQGTTIRLFLPRTAESAAPKSAAVPVAIAGGNEVVLVVDDEADIRANAHAILAGLGYRVREAASADEAVEVLKSHQDIDLVFTDVIMPGEVSSTQLAALAQRLRPGIPVLFTSGYSADAIIHQGKLASGVNLLKKPYTSDELARTIRTVLARVAHPT